MMLAAAGAIAIGLVWGWWLVQVIASLRPSPWSVAGMGAATAVLLLVVYVPLGGKAVALCAAAMTLAALGHAAMTVRPRGHRGRRA